MSPPDPIARLRIVRAVVRVDTETVKALKEAQKRDVAELPTMSHTLTYCLKLGIEQYLAGQPDDEDSHD